jgi:hypothetical protein
MKRASIEAVIHPLSMATTTPDPLRDVRPGQLVRVLLVGGGELVGDYEGYTDELDHSLATVKTREGRATIRAAHVAAVVELDRGL